MTDHEREIVSLTRQLLKAIFAADWESYVRLCDESITAIEPEACGHLVEGIDFHRFYFDPSDDGFDPNRLDRGGPDQKVHVTISSPHVRMMGDAAVIAYVRLVQSVNMLGEPETRASEETRVWQRIEGRWRHVHFHRSPIR